MAAYWASVEHEMKLRRKTLLGAPITGVGN